MVMFPPGRGEFGGRTATPFMEVCGVQVAIGAILPAGTGLEGSSSGHP